MFIVKDMKYNWYHYCKTIEKAKEIFTEIFMRWVAEDYGPVSDFTEDCNTWEELLEHLWNTDQEWDDVVWCSKIIWEEDENRG